VLEHVFLDCSSKVFNVSSPLTAPGPSGLCLSEARLVYGVGRVSSDAPNIMLEITIYPTLEVAISILLPDMILILRAVLIADVVA
jgi:hypothetical protein